MASTGFWDDARRAQALVRERNDLSRLVGRTGELSRELADVRSLWEMSLEEGDESLEPRSRRASSGCARSCRSSS
jgi:hypothetical protein